MKITTHTAVSRTVEVDDDWIAETIRQRLQAEGITPSGSDGRLIGCVDFDYGQTFRGATITWTTTELS
nr:hypothetical protein [uncultured Sphingomonas sp.]